MPIKSSPKQTPFNGYVSINLSEADEKIILAESVDLGHILALLAAECKNGYSLTIKPKLGEPGFKMSMQDHLEVRGSYGYILSGEGPDLMLAASVLFYKHKSMMNGEWSPFCAESRKTTGLR